MKDALVTAAYYFGGVILSAIGFALLIQAGDPTRGVKLPPLEWHEKPSKWRGRW